MKKSTYYYGGSYSPTIMREMSYIEALTYKINCGNRLLKSFDSTFGIHYRDIYNAIVDNQKLLDEVHGLPVEFFEPGECREYVPKNYLID
jgi:hypothetical protein